MCGIAGVIDSRGRPVEQALLKSMADRMMHRGPDDEGFYRNARAEGQDTGAPVSAGLAFRRLSIIDLEGGHQPMANEDGSLRLVFNGEIYNFQELRTELEALGHRFATRSDGETIMHLYESYGPRGALERLRGMFAFALWDERSGTAFLARDRVGKKPLVFHEQDGRLCFASELAALLQDSRIRREIDWNAVYHYLTFMCVPAPLTAFRGVRKLPPAHYLLFRNGETEIHRYWSLEYVPKLKVTRPEACERIRELFLEAVRLRLISDVPLGAFLSGGIDSSATVAAMSLAGGGKVRTFSIGFEEKKFNELPFARLVAERYGTEHHEFTVRPNALEVLPELVEHYGEPYADSSAIPTYYLSKMTREFVTVALNGDGGDESFSGYRRHWANRIAGRIYSLPPFLRDSLIQPVRALPGGSNYHSRLNGMRRFAEAANLAPSKRYTHWTGFFSEREKRALLSPALRSVIGELDSSHQVEALFAGAVALDGVDAALLTDVNFYLPNDLLVKVDIATMAVSLEGRSPFLDHRLMEYAAGLPSSFKVRGRQLKSILKEAVSPWLPREILNKPKWGFAVPIGEWFRGEMRDFLRDNILGPAAMSRGFFDQAEVERFVAIHLRGERDLGHHLWILLMLELWLRAFIDGRR